MRPNVVSGGRRAASLRLAERELSTPLDPEHSAPGPRVKGSCTALGQPRCVTTETTESRRALNLLMNRSRQIFLRADPSRPRPVSGDDNILLSMMSSPAMYAR